MNKKTTDRISLEYYVLDVFSNKSYKGNPLSVVFTNGNIELVDYQNISREFGYSETSFVFYSKDHNALNIRSFTPSGFEVGGAGHNLLGAVCGALLKGMRIFEAQDENKRFVMMKDSPIILNINIDNINQSSVVQMQQKRATFRQTIPADKIAAAVGLIEDDLRIDSLVPTVVQTEVAHVMVPIKTLELLNDCVPDNKKLIELSKQYQFEGFYCFAFTTQNSSNIVESRFFNPLIGIDEDAATGTAAGPLIGFLTKNNYTQLNRKYKILQGLKLNQRSIIDVMVRENDILVGGSSIITMQGEIYL